MFSFSALNYPSILVVGCLLYLLGSLGASSKGAVEVEEAESSRPRRRPLVVGGVTFLATLLFCLAMALVVQGFGVKTFWNGALVGLLVGVGILAPVSFLDRLHRTGKIQPVSSSVGRHLVSAALAAAILAATR